MTLRLTPRGIRLIGDGIVPDVLYVYRVSTTLDKSNEETVGKRLNISDHLIILFILVLEIFKE